MSDHYYSSKPSSKSSLHTFDAELLGNRFTYQTDNGVFSKDGIDFGSQLLIEAADIRDGDTILDLGCAYGAVGITVAKAYPNSIVTMVEINERACELARGNADRNGVAERVKIYNGDGFTPVQDRKFDHILLNPPIRAGKSLIYSLFTQAIDHLESDGSFWIVIRKQQGAESALKKLKEDYSSVEVTMKKKGYWIIQSKK